MSSQVYSPKTKTTPEVGVSPTQPLAGATTEAEVLSSVVLSEDPRKAEAIKLKRFCFPRNQGYFSHTKENEK